LGIKEENIRIIFGLKIRQLRLDKKLSLSELSKTTGISISYLNEIEKGKKYPKTNKIAILANALDIDYNYLVSLQLNKKLAPIADLLNSNIIADIPLDVYGIDKSNVIDLLSDAPTKLSAFVSTLIQIGRNYNMTVENFYFAVLTSFIEMHSNYFEDIEDKAARFLKEYKEIIKGQVCAESLENILTGSFDYRVDYEYLSFHEYLNDLRSVTKPGDDPVLFLNKNLNERQRAFSLALELGFQYLGLKERPYATTWVEINSFEEVLNNYKATYFANALLMNKDQLAKDLKKFFANKTFDPEGLVRIKEKYNASTEMFVNRLMNVIPKYFDINEVFFLTFNHEIGAFDVTLAKEIHLSGLHSPHANLQSEYYCRRWKAIDIIREFEALQEENDLNLPICRAQRSIHVKANPEAEYLVFAFARNKLPASNLNMSISIGLKVSDNLKRHIRFWDDPAIEVKRVGNTCERCAILDCKERVSKPIVMETLLADKLKREAVRNLIVTE